MAEVRKIDVEAPEGAGTEHTAYEYQLGEEIDGVFVPFVTKSGGYIDALVTAGKQAQQSNEQTTQQPASQPESGNAANTTTGGGGFSQTPAGGEQSGEGGAA